MDRKKYFSVDIPIFTNEKYLKAVSHDPIFLTIFDMPISITVKNIIYIIPVLVYLLVLFRDLHHYWYRLSTVVCCIET